jgi:hypothetical protein
LQKRGASQTEYSERYAAVDDTTPGILINGFTDLCGRANIK